MNTWFQYEYQLCLVWMNLDQVVDIKVRRNRKQELYAVGEYCLRQGETSHVTIVSCAVNGPLWTYCNIWLARELKLLELGHSLPELNHAGEFIV